MQRKADQFSTLLVEDNKTNICIVETRLRAFFGLALQAKIPLTDEELAQRTKYKSINVTYRQAMHDTVATKLVEEAMRDGHQFDLIIMDNTLIAGSKKGFEITRLIRDLEDQLSVSEENKAFIVSFTTDSEFQDRCYYGADTFIKKPLDRNEFHDLLTKTIIRKTGVEEEVLQSHEARRKNSVPSILPSQQNKKESVPDLSASDNSCEARRSNSVPSVLPLQQIKNESLESDSSASDPSEDGMPSLIGFRKNNIWEERRRIKKESNCQLCQVPQFTIDV